MLSAAEITSYRARPARALAAHPGVVCYFEYLLGPHYTFSTLISTLIYPGAADNPFQVENALSAMLEPLPSFPMFV